MRDHKENMKKVGYRIKCAINDSGTSQQELGNLLDVNPSTISQWANGHCYPSVASLIDFCDLIGCNIGYILSGNGDSGVTERVPSGIKEMKQLHDSGAVSDKIYYSFLEEKLEEMK